MQRFSDFDTLGFHDASLASDTQVQPQWVTSLDLCRCFQQRSYRLIHAVDMQNEAARQLSPQIADAPVVAEEQFWLGLLFPIACSLITVQHGSANCCKRHDR